MELPLRDNALAEPDVSVIVPCHDEAPNLKDLHAALARAFPADTTPRAEFVLVDDGSTDATPFLLADLAGQDPRVVPVRLAVRSGQTHALARGLAVARGAWVAHLDGDLQNDPADLPDLLRLAADENLDAVLGYRAARHDDTGRRLASRFANGVRRAVLGDSIIDIGCSTRVVRRDVLKRLAPVPNLHRYLPAVIQLGGWRIRQVAVRHHPRRHGDSKYGNLGRGIDGLRDLPRMSRYISRLRQARRKEAPDA